MTSNYFKTENYPSMLAKHELNVRGHSTSSILSIQSLQIISQVLKMYTPCLNYSTLGQIFRLFFRRGCYLQLKFKTNRILFSGLEIFKCIKLLIDSVIVKTKTKRGINYGLTWHGNAPVNRYPIRAQKPHWRISLWVIGLPPRYLGVKGTYIRTLKKNKKLCLFPTILPLMGL